MITSINESINDFGVPSLYSSFEWGLLGYPLELALMTMMTGGDQLLKFFPFFPFVSSVFPSFFIVSSGLIIKGTCGGRVFCRVCSGVCLSSGFIWWIVVLGMFSVVLMGYVCAWYVD